MAAAAPARRWTAPGIIGLVLATLTAGVLGVAFLAMVGPAAARERRAACTGLRPEPTITAAALCGPGVASCNLPVPAPDFTVTDHAGKPVRLSDYRGKVVLLNFWASWCGVCKAEKPAIEELARELGGADFEVVTLASDADWANVLMAMAMARAPAMVPERFRRSSPPPDQPTLAEALDIYGKVMPSGTPYQVFLDKPAGGGNIGEVAHAWGTSAVPESFLIDRTGQVRYYFVNKRDWRSAVAQTCLKSVIDE